MFKTRQELFDMAYKGLAAQGWLRSHDGWKCMYRSSDGLKCAIGHCIPDKLYSPSLENLSATSLFIMRPIRANPDDREFVKALQRCHDSGYDIQAAYKVLAEEEGLTIPE